jgi:hypothetical protein
MKSFKVQLYESIDGPLVGAPDYIVKKAEEADVPLKLILPDGRYMIIDVSMLNSPYKISEPIENRNYPDIGNKHYRYYNYLFKATVPNIFKDIFDEHKEELLEEGKYDSFEDLKKAEPVVAKVAEVAKTSTTEASYVILTKKMVETVVPSSTTFWGYIGHIVKTKREELNLTDKEVVERIISQQRIDKKSFSINTYRSIERGEDTNSKMKTYIHIAEALDLHVSELIPPKN